MTSIRGRRTVGTRARRGTVDPLPWWLVVATLALVGAAVPVLVTDHFGALGIPRNDDWSYLRSAFTLGQSGHLDGNGWVTVSLVGQLVLALPVVWALGSRVSPLQLEVVALGVVGLVAVYDVGRAVVGARRALFVALVVAVGPLWAPLAVSFMTDVPSFSLGMVALAAGIRALRPAGLRRGWFVGSLVAGLVAASIRDNAFVVVPAIGVVALWCSMRWSRADRRLVVTGLVVAVLAFLAFWRWKTGLQGFEPDAAFGLGGSDARDALRRFQGLLAPLGLCVAPAVVLAGPIALLRRSWARAPATSAVVAGGVLVAVGQWFAATGNLTGPGNYLARTGTLGTSVIDGDRPDLLGPGTYGLVGLLGLLAVVVLAVACVAPLYVARDRVRGRGWGPPTSPALALVGIGTLGVVGFMFVSRAMGNALWDRYLLVLVPLVSILVLAAGDAARRVVPVASSDAVRRGGAVAALAVLAAVGSVFGANSASYDGTRWEVAAAVAREAGGPRRVDAGFEWNSHHAGREAYFSGRRPSEPCVVVRSEARAPDTDEADVLAAAEVWGPTGDGGWVVARSTGRCTEALGR